MALAIDLTGKTILVCGAGAGGIAMATVTQLVLAGARNRTRVHEVRPP